MNTTNSKHKKLLDLYSNRELLIFVQGADWFNQQAIELLKGTLNRQYPNKDWQTELIFWEIDHDVLKLE